MRRRAPLEMKLTKNDRGRGRERGRERDREIDREGEKKTDSQKENTHGKAERPV